MLVKYDGQELDLRFTEYQDNDRPAIVLYETEPDSESYIYAVLSVNIEEDITDEYCTFIDVNNCGEKTIDWLIKNNIAEPTGQFGMSGFCTYPEVRINREILEKEKVC